MKLGKTACAFAAAATAALGTAGWMLTSHRPHLVTASFNPAYPEANGSGDPILAVLEGIIPCSIPHCKRIKVQLVLYENKKERTPTTYWLGVIGTHGNDRIVTEGNWEIRRGVVGYPDALVYALDLHTDKDLRYFWRVTDNILLPLDEHIGIFRRLRRPPGVKAGLAAKNHPDAGNCGVSMYVNSVLSATGTDANGTFRHPPTHFLRPARSL